MQHRNETTGIIRDMKMFVQKVTLFLLSYALLSSPVAAKGTYLKPELFVQQAFTVVPAPSVIWIKDELRSQVEAILQHKYKGKRVRYWRQGERSVWILEEIGKKKPITVGIVIDQQKISELKVLVFRETRGWEVRYPFFTRQFEQVFLNDEQQLSNSIDGISGATLSVRALKKLARVSLLLDRNSSEKVAQQVNP